MLQYVGLDKLEMLFQSLWWISLFDTYSDQQAPAT
jgi:hypothetical protein